jgi:hypothetical protein
VPKRTGAAAGGVGAGTASQMARQREAIAAREKREAEDAAKKAKREPAQKKEVKSKEVKETQHKEKVDKTADAPGPSKSTRSKPATFQVPKAAVRSVPAAPRKAAVLSKTKSQSGPRKVDIKEVEPDIVAAVTAPLPGSPLATAEVQSIVVNGANTDVEDMVLDVVAGDNAVEAEREEVPSEAGEPAPEAVQLDAVQQETDEQNDMDEDEDASNEANQTIMAADIEEPVQTPPRAMPVSLIDQTPASTPMTSAPSGFAFHPQLAQLMAHPPQPTEEIEDFLVDLSSPPAKERPTEKDGVDRYALGERGNTNSYLSQFTQDMMMLSGL